MKLTKTASHLFVLSTVVLCPSLAVAHGDHQHVGGTLALVEHLAAHVDYLAVALIAVVGIIVWMKTPDN